MYRRSRIRTLGVFAVLHLMLVAPPAAAASWCSPVDGATIALGYGAAYGDATHSGVDLAAATGARVLAPTSGTVVFAGNVPADGGGTCGAVTVETEDGLRISLLPLTELTVERGSSLAAGDAVGSVAASGDDSSPEPHLHLSLRRGETYLDPSGYLPAAAAPSVPLAPEPAPQPPQQPPASSGGASVPAAAPACVPAVAPTPVPVAAAPIAEAAPAGVGTVVAVADTLPAEPEAASESQPYSPQSSALTTDGGVSWAPVRTGASLALLIGMAGTAAAIVRQRRLAGCHV